VLVEQVYHSLLGPDFNYRFGMMNADMDLFLVNVLANRRDMAKFFWKSSDQPVRSAITASYLLRKMAKRKEIEPAVQKQMLDNADYFEDLATAVLKKAQKSDRRVAVTALNAPLRLWKQKSLLDLAIMSSCDRFVEACGEEAIHARLYGDINPYYNSQWKILFLPTAISSHVLCSVPWGHSVVIRGLGHIPFIVIYALASAAVCLSPPDEAQNSEAGASRIMKRIADVQRIMRRIVHAAFLITYNPPPFAESIRGVTQRRSIPGYAENSWFLPNSPNGNGKYPSRSGWKLSEINDHGEYPNKPNWKLFELKDKRRGISYTGKKPRYRQKAMEEQEKQRGSCGQHRELNDLWYPTFSIMERTCLFLWAPITRYYLNTACSLIITGQFILYFVPEAQNFKDHSSTSSSGSSWQEVIFCVYHSTVLLFEICEMWAQWDQDFSYFLDVWNIFDLVPCFLFLAGFMTGFHNEDVYPSVSFGGILLFCGVVLLITTFWSLRTITPGKSSAPVWVMFASSVLFVCLGVSELASFEWVSPPVESLKPAPFVSSMNWKLFCYGVSLCCMVIKGLKSFVEFWPALHLIVQISLKMLEDVFVFVIMYSMYLLAFSLLMVGAGTPDGVVDSCSPLVGESLLAERMRQEEEEEEEEEEEGLFS